MNVYTNTLFEGRYPVGVAAVVQAENKKEAATKLRLALKKRGLGKDVKAIDMIELTEEVVILLDGNY